MTQVRWRSVWIRAAGYSTALLCLGATDAKTLRIALSTPPGPLDPATARTPEEFAPAAPAYEQLVSPTGGPEVAASWHVDAAQRRWTFRIAPGHHFTDGRAVDAAAVKFSLDRVLAVGRGNAGDIIDHLAAIEVIDPVTVVVTTKASTPRLPAILADRSASIVDPRVMAHAVGSDRAAGWLAANTAGSGPYRLRPTRGGGVMLLERNPGWTLSRPAFDTIVYRAVADPIVRGMGVSRDASDIAVLMPAQVLPRLERDRAIRVISAPVPAYQNLAFNLDRTVFRDGRVRRAIGAAIDAASIVRYIRGGRVSTFRGPLAPGMPGYDPALYPVRFDSGEAMRLARAAGVKKGTRVSMIYPGVSPETDTVAQYIQAVLAPLGFQVRLERLSIPAYVDRMQRGSYDLVLMGFVATTDDASGVLNFWFDRAKAGVDNPARYDNPQVTRLVNQAANEADLGKRAALHRQIAMRVNAELPYIYLQQTHVANVVRRELTGYRLDPLRPLEFDTLALRRR
jgi:peptide/nickel transport system substrate-binding protein